MASKVTRLLSSPSRSKSPKPAHGSTSRQGLPRPSVRGSILAVAAVTAASALAPIGLGPVAAQAPEAAVPINANLYDLTFTSFGGSTATGVGYMSAPTSGTGPGLSVEISGLDPNTTYNARLGGPVDANTNPSSCSQSAGQLGSFGGAAGEFKAGGGPVQTGPEGVLRWSYDQSPAFTSAQYVDFNAGEPVVVVTTASGNIVACAEMAGNLISSPQTRNFPLALKGGQTPVRINGSDIKVSGNARLTGTLFSYDFVLSGTDLINNGAGLQNHLLALRSTDNCGNGSLTTNLQNITRNITNLGTPSTPMTTSTLEAVWFRSPLSGDNTLRVRGATIVDTSDANKVADYGLVLFGLESGSTARPNGPGTLNVRETTPSACISLVDKASEVGFNGVVAEATTLQELINATDYDTSKDPEILRLYTAFFGRQPDVAGVKYWIGVSRGDVDGKTYSGLQIAAFFEPQKEFQLTFADAPDNSEFLRRVYQNILGRQGEAAGVAYWTDILNGRNDSGRNPELSQGTRSEVVFYVAINPEFVNKLPYLP